jgi:hypothetical protein
MMGESFRCTKCGTPFEFVDTVTGRAMPVELAPHPKGNIVIRNGVAEVLKRGDPRWGTVDPGELRISHFANCAYARDYRKRHPKEPSRGT